MLLLLIFLVEGNDWLEDNEETVLDTSEVGDSDMLSLSNASLKTPLMAVSFDVFESEALGM